MKEILLFSKYRKYTGDEIIKASGKIAAAIRKSGFCGKDLIIDTADVFGQITAELAAWSLDCRVFEMETGAPGGFRRRVVSGLEGFSLVIDKEFIEQALLGSDTEAVSPRFYGTILFHSLNGELCELKSDEMKQRFEFLKSILCADRDETYFYGTDMSFLKFFPLYCGNTACFDCGKAADGSLVIMPSAEFESNCEKPLVSGAGVIITYGSETYGENEREKIKKSGKSLFHIFDLPMFTFITSGTNYTGIPVKDIGISVVNSSGVAQSHGMKGYIRYNDSGRLTGYEGVYLGKGKYELSYRADMAVARGKRLDKGVIESVVRSIGNTEVIDVQVRDNRMYICLNSDEPLSEIVRVIDAELPCEYSNVKLSKASSVQNGEHTYTSEHIRELIRMGISSNISIDSVYDRKFTLEISGTEKELAAVEKVIRNYKNINRVIFRNTLTGESEEKSYQSLKDNEIKVISIFSEILGNKEVDPDDNFFELGGNSLMFVKLCFELENLTHKKIDTNLFFMNATPSSYCRLAYENADNEREDDIMKLSGKVTPEQLISDSALNAFVPENKKPLGNNIFLTGATGFLGTFLLSELLKKTDRVIYCLVRAENKEEGLRRLRASAEKYGQTGYFNLQRVKAIPGDLSENRLGMSDEDYEFILNYTDKIVHAGAKVDFMCTYSMLKKTNVDSVREVIDIASHGARKELHYISTLAILEDNMYQGEAAEDFDNKSYPSVIFGYNQSKWVSDVLVQRAMENGISANIYRIGTACGDTVGGRWQENDLIRSVCMLCLKVGTTPLFEHILHLIPVDRLASSIVSCVNMGIDGNGRIFHLGGGRKMTVVQMAKWFNNYDLDIRIVSGDEWINSATKYVEANRDELKDNAIFGIVSKGAGFNFDFGCKIITEKTDRYLEELGIEYKSITEEEFDKCLDSIKSETRNGNKK